MKSPVLLCAASLTLPFTIALAQSTSPPVPMSNPYIRILGRFQTLPNGAVRLGYPGTGFEVRFNGPSLDLTASSSSGTSALTLVVDHGEPRLLLLAKGDQTLPLVQQAGPGPHTVEVYKRTETWQGLVDLHALTLVSPDDLLPLPPPSSRKLLFIGDSVTCGTGVNNNAQCTEDPARPSSDAFHSYGMDLGRRLDAQVDLVCYGGRGLERDYRGLTKADGILNAPDFLDLAIATDSPSTRAPWNVRAFVPDGIVVSLGTNDFNLQKTKPLNAQAFIDDYVALLHRLRAEYPHAMIFLTEGAIVVDPLLRQYVRETVTRMHDPHIQWAPATHYPGNGCNGHPTREQHVHMADDLEPLLRTRLHW